MYKRIFAYIQRMRDMRRWAQKNDDPIMYRMVNDEIQFWKRVIGL